MTANQVMSSHRSGDKAVRKRILDTQESSDSLPPALITRKKPAQKKQKKVKEKEPEDEIDETTEDSDNLEPKQKVKSI